MSTPELANLEGSQYVSVYEARHADGRWACHAQEAGVLVSRRAHGAHHKAPFEGNYCIVSGFWNPILDAEGSDASFFRRLERFVLARTGEASSNSTRPPPDVCSTALS